MTEDIKAAQDAMKRILDGYETCPHRGMSTKSLMELKDSPDNLVHDWRSHLNDDIIAVWDFIPLPSKAFIQNICKTVADAEDWD